MLNLLRILMAALVVLMTAGTSFASGLDAVKDEVARTLIERSPWAEGTVEVTDINLSSMDENLVFDDLEVDVPRGARNTGKVSVFVRLFNNGKEVKGFWASARMKAYKEAVVALKPLKINSVIKSSDVTLVKTEVTDTQDSVASIEEITGMLVKRPIQAGALIKKDFVKQKLVVKRGDKVVLLVSSDRLSIKSKAVAEEDGPLGSTIIARTNSGKEVSAKVTGPGELTVEF